MPPDPRRIIGNIAACKSIQVTSIQECSRRYGSNAKTRILEGVLVEVFIERKTTTFWLQTYIEADWEHGNRRTKRAW